MQFFVQDILDYSAKANVITLQFVNVGGLLEGLAVRITAPKSLELKANALNEVPAWVAKNIWGGWNASEILKALQKQAQAKAPAGSKKTAREKVMKELAAAQALNVELPPEQQPVTGEFVGTKGENVVLHLTFDKVIADRYGVDEFRWRQGEYGWEHPTWHYTMYSFLTDDGNTVIFKTYSERARECLDKGTAFTFKAKVVDQEVYHNCRQTTIAIGSYKDIAPCA